MVKGYLGSKHPPEEPQKLVSGKNFLIQMRKKDSGQARYRSLSQHRSS